MFWQIVTFELRYRLKRPATYIYFFLFFGLAFLFVAMPDISFGESGEKLFRNAPVLILQLMLALMMFGSIVCAAIMGVPVYRDFDSNFHEIMFSIPVKKWEYLWGRFTGSFVISILIFSGIMLGMMLGFAMPWQEKELIGPFMLNAYLNPFLFFIIPNLFIIGILFFIVGSYFRSQAAIYAQGVLFLVLYSAISLILSDATRNPVYSLFDTFGSEAVAQLTKYWTTFEKNTLIIPIENYVFWNRLLWLGISGTVAVWFTWKFKLMRESNPFGRKRKKASAEIVSTEETIPETDYQQTLGIKQKLYQWWFLSRFYLRTVIRSVPFLIMVLCAIGLMALARMGQTMYGTHSLPVTYMLLDHVVGSFMLFLIIIIIVYSGELIWKDISLKFASIIDASPLSNRQILLSKFSAMILAELFLLLIIILTGITVQIINGFYEFKILVYIKSLLLNTFPYLFLITMLTFLIHTLAGNKFLGHGLVILFYALNIASGRLGVKHIMLKYGSSLSESYSDMNGFHKFISPVLTLNFYWLMLGIVFFSISLLLIKRGSELRLSSRFKLMKLYWKQGYAKIIIPGALILFIISGFTIYYNTNILNTYRTKVEDRHFKGNYEKTYSKYKDYPQPRITDVTVNCDLYPRESRCAAEGTYILVNKSGVEIDTLHLRILPQIDFYKAGFSKKVDTISVAKEYGYTVLKLNEGLNPGDTLIMDFAVRFQEKGFSNWGKRHELVPNGTFLHAELLPFFGYDESMILTKKKDRKKEGLPERTFESAELNDTLAYKNTYISHNADRIRYSAVLSTDMDQTALTCGTLVKEWTKNGRRYFRYEMKEPIWNFVPFLSASYEIKKENFNGTELAIYYHKGHEYNIDKMMDAMKKTIAYCNKNFSPYQHDILRIVEFPRYSTYAQSFPGIIPFSEGLGFIIDVDKKNDIDVPFYVACHEVAHQWWGHQICAADVKGKLLMVESLANYTALMVMEKQFGIENISKFLEYEQNQYLTGRAIERKKEAPLYLVDDQTYVAYQKGSVALYSLKDYIGEKNLNGALKNFTDYYAYREAPYPTSIDFLNYIEKAIPDSMNYLVGDLFKTITLFSNRIDSTYYSENQKGQYDVKLFATCQKFTADSIGKQEEVTPNDWIDVGFFVKSSANKDSLIYRKKIHVDSLHVGYTVTLNQKPEKAGIDPRHLLIDRNLDDNIKNVSSKI